MKNKKGKPDGNKYTHKPNQNHTLPKTQGHIWHRAIGSEILPTSCPKSLLGSARHVQKGHPTLVTQVDLILQNR